MLGRLMLVCATVGAIGCGGATVEPIKTASTQASLDAFAGSWNSITPSYEFIRLTVVSKSVEQGAIGARLTLSGLAFDGSARIDADSLIATLSVAGSTTSNATLVARARDGNTLIAQFRSSAGSPLALTFVRQ